MNEEISFPTETIELPSKGLLYEEDNPLSSGYIDIKYPTAKEEDILTSQSLMKKGLSVEKFLQALIVNKNINYNDILVGDINAIMIASRILAYGSSYSVEATCPSCGKKQKVNIDLSKLENNPIDEDVQNTSKNLFEFKFPISEKKITFKLLTQGKSEEAKNISKRLYAKLKKDSSFTTRLKTMIVSVEGSEDRTVVDKFVDNMLSKDSLEFRKYLNKLSPDINMDI